jgi:hypothetical protein
MSIAWGSQKERNYYQDEGYIIRILLKRILARSDEVVGSGLTWLRVGTSGRLF